MTRKAAFRSTCNRQNVSKRQKNTHMVKIALPSLTQALSLVALTLSNRLRIFAGLAFSSASA